MKILLLLYTFYLCLFEWETSFGSYLYINEEKCNISTCFLAMRSDEVDITAQGCSNGLWSIYILNCSVNYYGLSHCSWCWNGSTICESGVIYNCGDSDLVGIKDVSNVGMYKYVSCATDSNACSRDDALTSTVSPETTLTTFPTYHLPVSPRTAGNVTNPFNSTGVPTVFSTEPSEDSTRPRGTEESEEEYMRFVTETEEFSSSADPWSVSEDSSEDSSTYDTDIPDDDASQSSEDESTSTTGAFYSTKTSSQELTATTSGEAGYIKENMSCSMGTCLLNECYFKGYCYFVKQYDKDGLGGDEVTRECGVGSPGSLGVAVETLDEMDFIVKLLSANNLREIFLSSGYRNCCSCKEPDEWRSWGKLVNQSLLSNILDTENCSAPSYYVFNISEEGLIWTIKAEGDEPASFLMCRREMKPITTTTVAKPPSRMTSNKSATTTTTLPTTIRTTTRRTTRTTARSTTASRECRRCRAVDQYGNFWYGCVGTNVSNRCPNYGRGRAWWYCSTAAFFLGRTPNYRGCSHPWVNEVKTMVQQGQPAEEIAILVTTHAENNSFFGHEIPELLQVLNSSYVLHANQTSDIAELSERLYNTTVFTDIVAGALGQLLQCFESWIQLNESERMSVAVQLQNLSHEVGFSLASMAAELSDNNYTYNATFKKEDAVLLEVLVPETDDAFKFPYKDNQSTSYIEIAKQSTLKLYRPRSVGMMISSNSGELLYPPSMNSFQDSRDTSKILNSVVISFTLKDMDESSNQARSVKFSQDEVDMDQDVVNIVFRHPYDVKGPEDIVIRRSLYDGETATAVRGSAKCVFWNKTLGNQGMWDDSGCRVVITTDEKTHCACSHLSTFAILMDMHEYVGKDEVLEVMTLTCSGLSVVCLLLTLLVFHGCRSIQGERTSIGKQLCICLLLAHGTTVTLLDKSYFNISEEFCSFVAAFLHYFFLASFCWMAIEGHYLYRLVVRVFDNGRSVWTQYMLVGYGVPAFIVGATEAVAAIKEDKAYGRDELCWLSSPYYIWSFIGPVIFLTGMNVGIVVMALRAAVVAGLSQGKSRKERVGVWLKGWFSLCSLLGITWLFGLFFMEYSYTFQYIFVILNGCQGVFIFLFRCLLNKQIRKSVVHEAKQRAHINNFNRNTPRRSSWIVSSNPSGGRHQSADSGRGESDFETETKEKEATPEDTTTKFPSSFLATVKCRDIRWDQVFLPGHVETGIHFSRHRSSRCSRIEEEGESDY